MKKKVTKIKHAVVIVNYNGWSDTCVCLRSVMASKDRPHVIVIDNASTDNSVKLILQAFPNIELVASDKNLGYSGGNNLGIKLAMKKGARVIYLLNNDTEVDSNLFFRAYRYVSGKKRIAGGKIYYARGFEFHHDHKMDGNRLWYAGGDFDWSMAVARHHGVDEQDQGQYDKLKDVSFITGCFMAIPREVINKVGYLDESYFLYLEDAEYCLRASRNKIELKYNPSLIVFHRNSSTTVSGSDLVDYYLTRNRLLIAKSYGSLRLRFALMREALRNWSNLTRRRAFIDYLSGNLGKQA